MVQVKTEVAHVKSNVIRLENGFSKQHRKQQANAQRRNNMHPIEVMRDKAWRFAGCACMCCGRKLWLYEDEADTPNDVANIEHVVPVHNGGRLTWDNIQVLCPRPCHDRKTLAERLLGRHDASKDYRDNHPGFKAKCAEQQEKDTLQQRIQMEREALPLFDGSCLPLRH